MTDADRTAFVECMQSLCSAFRVEADKPLLRAYWRALSDLDAEAIVTACDEALRQMRFMPRPAELRAFVNGATAEDMSLLTWPIVMRAIAAVGPYHAPAFDDARIAAAVDMIGGWVHLCELSAEELERFYRGRFLEAYRAACRTNVSVRPLLGIHDQDKDALPSPEAIAKRLQDQAASLRDQETDE